MSNRAKLQGPFVGLLSCQPLSNLCLDCFRSPPSAIPYSLVAFKPSATLSQPGVLAIAPVRMLGSCRRLALRSVRLSFRGEPLILPSLSMLAALLTSVAVVAGTLGIWRLAADPGWTSRFFIASGLLSHWQAWFTLGIGARASSRGLNKWLDIQAYKAKPVAGRPETTAELRRTAGPVTAP